MATRNLRRRIKKAEKVAETRDQFSAECLCFPKNEQPRFAFPIMQELAARVKCPRHGERFKPQASIYTSKWLREKVGNRLETFHSEQYRKAWSAGFPPHLWPAEEIPILGIIHLRLKDGTLLRAECVPMEEVHSKTKPSDTENIGNSLLNRFRWDPKTLAQRNALDCPADLLLLGGAAGSLKTTTLLIDIIQEFDNPKMNSYFFRKSYPELEDTLAQAHEIFSQMGARFTDVNKLFRFPSGARVHFRYIQSDNDLHQNHGKDMSAIAIDESTHFPQEWVRYLLTRNRRVDTNLKPRMRLGTNPGNIGNTWHMNCFFNGVCPHCCPELAPKQAVPFFGAKWSDGIPLAGLSVAYILSSVRDHNLLGDEYIARLRTQKPATTKALLDGCWNICEGQYFDIFEPNRPGLPMVVPRAEVGAQWWWPRWVFSDYGFSISTAAAHLFIHEPPSEGFPRGRTYIYAELGEQQVPPNEFARQIVKEWVINEDGYPYRWEPWYLSPDAFANRGGPFTQAGQMNDVLEAYNLSFGKAANDREGGATRMYSAFQSGELVICAECRTTIEAVKTRLRDPKRENDVLKVLRDPRDDYYDSARYGYYSYETMNDHVPIPAEILRRERFERLRSQDPDMAATGFVLDCINQMRREAELEGEEAYCSPSVRMRHQIAKARRRWRW